MNELIGPKEWASPQEFVKIFSQPDAWESIQRPNGAFCNLLVFPTEDVLKRFSNLDQFLGKVLRKEINVNNIDKLNLVVTNNLVEKLGIAVDEVRALLSKEVTDGTTDRTELLLRLSIQHIIHQRFFGQFVLPTNFIEVVAPKDIIDKTDGFNESRKKQAEKLFSTRFIGNFRIMFEKGDKVQLMVQPDLKEFVPAMTLINQGNLSERQRVQLRQFYNGVLKLHEKTGLIPDKAILREDSNNLVFVGDRLIMMDTNELTPDNQGIGLSQFKLKFKDI